MAGATARFEARVENGVTKYYNVRTEASGQVRELPISKTEYEIAVKTTGGSVPAAPSLPNPPSVTVPTQSAPVVRYNAQTDPRSTQYMPPTNAGVNVLSKYRSYTYNFTLAAAPVSQINSLQGLKVSDLTNIILTSKGKGSSPGSFTNETPDELANKATELRAQANKHRDILESALGSAGAPIVNAQYDEAWRRKEQAAVTAETAVILNKVNTDSLAAGFSKSSAGRFDMFIDDVEIMSVIGKNGQTGSSTAFQFTFNVIEPYSVFGFIDALLIASQSAGYENYAVANYVLALDFMGYPDTGDLPSPVPIERSTRLFPIKIYDVTNTINERGTVYTCKAIPVGDAAVGTTVGQLKTSINVKGTTVKQQLSDLINQLNDAASKDAKANNRTVWDTYRIEFPNVNSDGQISEGENPWASSAISSDPVTNDKKDGKAVPSTQFDSGTAVQRAIEDILKKSEYFKSTVKPESGKDGDKQGNFWTLIPSVEQGTETNPMTNRKVSVYVYKIIPYFTSKHRVTGNENNLVKYDELAEIATRNYEYIYTGLNTEVLDFKINFNLAFFSPLAIGNPSVKDTSSTGNQNGSNPSMPNNGSSPPSPGNMPAVSVSTTAAANESRKNTSNNQDLWAQTANNVYKSIIDSPQAQFQGEITILGDPYFLVSANGLSIPDGQVQGKEASNGEATALVGEVYITINFYNPIDIDTNTGILNINEVPVPFSGVFSVYNVTSEFKNGVFKQVLFYTRIPTDRSADPVRRRSALQSAPNPNDQKVSDSAPATATQPTDANGVVKTASAQADKPPVAPPLTSVALTKDGAFSAGGNLVTKEQISLAQLKSLPNDLKSSITGPIDSLKASVASQVASVQGSVASLQSGIATGLTAEVAKVTGPISNSPLTTFINNSKRGLA